MSPPDRAPLPLLSSPAVLRGLGAGVGLLLAVGSAVMGGAPGLGERTLYDFAVSRLLPPLPTTADLVLVEVDDRAIAALGERWPLSRATWARAFQALAAQRPSAVVVDILFDQPESRDALDLGEDVLEGLHASGLAQLPEGSKLVSELEARLHAQDGDARLAETFSGLGKVVLGSMALTDEGGAVPGEGDTLAPVALPAEGLRLKAKGLTTNLAPLRMTAWSSGTLNVLVDADGVIRRYPYAVEVGGRAWPSLALATALRLWPERSEALLRVAATDDGAPLMRLPSPDWLPRVSLADVLLAGPSSVGLDLALRDKAVFVGVTATGLHGQSTLPGQLAVPGVEIHAFAMDNLRSGRVLRSTGRAALTGVVETAVVLALLLWRRGRARTMGAVVGQAALLLVAHTVFVGWLLADIGWVVPLLPGVVGLALVTLAEAVARTEDLQRQRGALKRLFGRFPSEAAVPPPGGQKTAEGDESSRSAPGDSQR
ncbi:CHASE2 domain-containing protein [Corallococcus praedator]|uniref:CHASE2 domain-containing protein n=1 Tax=Corallococcus praedator TaxID=2316724 RepID=A0ABX9QSS4_9BACT|nr:MULTISPECIES: CHASE2 domain-containing protein [Corallococcus]RKH33352.1 CHASE2 domain-containing protein [Corallococcus sp. CA031C]RKI16229.1 CHASE2 domain-containing protein [Corallococcus praedator]